MSGHTPGPWMVEGPDEFGDHNVIAQGARLAVAAVVKNLRPAPEVAANARLIAAAPDLLDVLRTTLGNIRSLGPAGDLDRLPAPYRVWERVVAEAIAKAEGRS